ncbi:unnamed protein product [Triticum turgidum subsp. durum]|uniref:AAA+ ATPase domain-containing protein n=1 Tax=Triticum turgidum subsp. durum TaxID=4567 RepID=A0A9R1PZY6_TRITD|nr:unnamed protein product [Triticum turgidum subsp. durum]
MEAAGIRAAAWVVGKALSPLSDGVLESWVASNMLGSNIEALKMELLRAQAVLNIAGGREIQNPALAEMLDKLRELAYGADDVLDEIDYFRIQDELDGTHHAADEHPAGCVRNLAQNAGHTARACVNTLNVGKHLSCFSSSASVNRHAQPPKLKFDRVEMSTRISDITEQLKPVCARVSNILNLELVNSSNTPSQDIAMNRPKTTPQIIEPKLYGRDLHKKTVLDEIANSEYAKLTVLPIVGPGGIGKTTFTQHIYKQKKSDFQVPIWICVSLDFNANRLAKDIVQKIPKVENENKNCSDEELIEQRLKGKRVLLVLDDVWPHHENEWKKVIAPFKTEDAKGNMVIVTTRIPELADTVKTTKCSLELERLCSVDIMSFFEECVFGDQEPWVDQPELADVGRKIVDKLKGSPLAARTVGRLLRNKLTLNHWRSVLESKEWQLQKDDNDIMPALKLSYDYLPFYLQRCFSFCALFPEDYEFGSEELVHLWIGLEILHSSDQNRKKLEDVGLCYLNNLVNHGFFKMNKLENKSPSYVIHDLLHDLAVKVSSDECICIYVSKVRHIEIPPSVRHLSIIVDNTDIEDRVLFEDYEGNLSALGERMKVENLRTLMLFGDCHVSFAKTFDGLFREARALRVIFLSGVSYNLEDILHNYSKLVHLRYLRVKLAYYYYGFCLSSSLCRLYHLEVIDLQDHYCDFRSIRHMRNLVKLRHFLVGTENLHLHSDIRGVGKLKFLQELREFRVGKKSEGFELSQLGPMKEIGGSLGIYNLENVQTKEEAKEAKLLQKNCLRELILEWDVKRSNKDHVKEQNVLASLVPHSNLEELCIRGHGGTNCPAWLCENLSVECLESLCLDGISWKNLPPLGEMWMANELGEEYQGCSISSPNFHNLRSLKLSNISCLKKWVGSGTCPLFSHLEVLVIRGCPELIELPFSQPPTCSQAWRDEKIGWFPRLWKIVIVGCPKLVSFPPIPWRTCAPCSAYIAGVGSCFEELIYPRRELELNLKIEGRGGQGDVFWSGLNFSNLTDLEELCMKKIPFLPLEHLRALTSLKKIEINGASSFLLPVEGANDGIYRFPVEHLEITGCDVSGKELTLMLSFLPNLSKLRISDCENITGLGVAEGAETISGEQQEQETRVGEEELITAAAAEGLLLLPPHLQELWIFGCKNMSILSNPMHDNDHKSADSGEGGGGGLQRLRSLRCLYVWSCPKFLSSYSSTSSVFPFPTCLQGLTLNGAKYMETLHALSNLSSLSECELFFELSGSDGLWSLLSHGCLTKLSLDSDSNFFSACDPSIPTPVSTNPLYLRTGSSTGFLSAPICSLLSPTLTKLDLMIGEEVECFTKEQEEALQLLTSLQELRFSILRENREFLWKLQRLPAGLHKLINLKKLTVDQCSSIRSLPCLPSSLQELVIVWCCAIQSLPNSLPNSLEKLTIYSCNDIKSLPRDGLPSSMRVLDVLRDNSEELRRECRKLKGTIPIVRA